MSEQQAYTVIFAYDNPRVFDAQSEYFKKNCLDEAVCFAPKPLDYFDCLVSEEYWNTISFKSEPEPDRILTEFRFTSGLKDAGTDPMRVVEAAAFDMCGWLHEVKLDALTAPTLVELVSDDQLFPHRDLTQEAILIINSFAIIRCAEPTDF